MAKAGKGEAVRKRADLVLVERGLFESRARARAAIDAGLVIADDKPVSKASEVIPEDAVLQAQPAHPWVSRGGVKLAGALEQYPIPVEDRICLDVGASTGGFTEVLLAKGAAKVYAVDVGHGQLDWKLREDKRVAVLERTNARHLTRELIPEAVDLVVCDASFIGLRTVLPAPLALTKPAAALVALVKPQFEAGPGQVGKGGIVRDDAVRAEVCETISAWLAAQRGWRVLGIVPSPIEGADGNKEFLIAARKSN